MGDICKALEKNVRNSFFSLTLDEGKKPSYQCEICDQKCTTKQSLTQHVLAVHEKKKPLACPHCDRNFAAKSTLKGRVSVQGVKSLGGHFACLCREFDFYEVKKKYYYFSKRKRKYFYTFNHFCSEKS
jgi:hypothetical protein